MNEELKKTLLNKIEDHVVNSVLTDKLNLKEIEKLGKIETTDF